MTGGSGINNHGRNIHETAMKGSTATNPGRIEKLLQHLINIYSPSGKEEEILDYLYGYLRRRDLPVRKQKVDENRYNLVVAPPDTEIRLVLVGHLDTVSAYDLDHYQAEQEGDLITGLGAADMKGGCAAMIETFQALRDQGHTRLPVALALVVGEEEEGDWARELVRDFQFKWALIGEPTDLVPCLSNYGYLEIQLSARGRRMHASLSSQVRNPIEAMLRLILSLTRHMDENRPELVYNIRDLWSSQAGFTVPDLCESWLDIHVPPSVKIPEIMVEFEDVFIREKDSGARIDRDLRFATIDPGFELPEKGPFVETVRDVFLKRGLPWKPAPFISHSDANQIWQAGVRPILLGPGQLDKAHTPDESVFFSQVCLAAEIYFHIVLAGF
jgi:acetylornithine deacetylase